MKTESMVVKGGALLMAGILGGCGGGGGNAGFAFPLTAGDSVQSAAAPAAVVSSQVPVPAQEAPTAEVAVPPDAEPVADENDPTACIANPQVGSTAAIGNGFEGVWSQSVGSNPGWGVMQVDPLGEMQGFTVFAESSQIPIDDNFYATAVFNAADASWQFVSGMATPASLISWKALTGSGSFTPKATLTGQYSSPNGTQKTFGPWVYDKANSLAVSPSLLEGAWGGVYAPVVGSITISSDGSFIGSTPATSLYGSCTLTGTVRVAEVGTKKNSLALMLAAVDASKGEERPCGVVGVTTGKGHVAVYQDEADTLCKRSMNLYFFLIDPRTGKSSGATLAFSK